MARKAPAPEPVGPEPYPPKGKKVDKKLRGGPWAKEKHTFRELEDGTMWPPELVLTDRDGGYVGRYVHAELQQKTRTLKIVEWETPEQYARALRLAVLRGHL